MTKKLKKKIIVLYHGDCADGFGGAWAAWEKLGAKADYLAMYREKPIPDVHGKEIYFIDYLYTPEIIKKILKNNLKVIGLDHHETTKGSIPLLASGSVYSDKNSGAVLAWKYFNPKKKIPMLLRYTEDQDTWSFKLSKTREIMTMVKNHHYDFATWAKLAKDLDNIKKRKEYIKKGKILLSYRDSLINKLAEEAEPVYFEGRKVFAVNAPHMFSSDLAHKLYTAHPPFAIIWIKQRGRIKVSLRGTGTPDLAKICEKYRGGGHGASAGFNFSANKPLPWKSVK